MGALHSCDWHIKVWRSSSTQRCWVELELVLFFVLRFNAQDIHIVLEKVGSVLRNSSQVSSFQGRHEAFACGIYHQCSTVLLHRGVTLIRSLCETTLWIRVPLPRRVNCLHGSVCLSGIRYDTALTCGDLVQLWPATLWCNTWQPDENSTTKTKASLFTDLIFTVDEGALNLNDVISKTCMDEMFLL